VRLLRPYSRVPRTAATASAMALEKSCPLSFGVAVTPLRRHGAGVPRLGRPQRHESASRGGPVGYPAGNRASAPSNGVAATVYGELRRRAHVWEGSVWASRRECWSRSATWRATSSASIR
jgi:hypothetical protein